MTVELFHRVSREDLAFGIVRVEGLRVEPAGEELAAALDELIAERATPTLDSLSEARRKAARDVLRNGRYKPTGRGKPASEYLLRAAREGEASFPRINGPVDANNLVSLRYLFPISIWDLDLAATDHFEFRLGGDERYVFNNAGQILELSDLVCGCALGLEGGKAPASRPIVTPIKDGMATKISTETTRLVGAIYIPLAVGGEALAHEVTEVFSRWLLRCGEDVEMKRGLLMPGTSVTI